MRLVAPDSEHLAAATRNLEERIEGVPGVMAAPVTLTYRVDSLAGIRVGQTELTSGLEKGLDTVVPWDVLRVQPESPFGTEAVDPGDPVIEIASAITPMDVFQGEGSRAFAALSFEYEAWLILPGEPRVLFIPKVRVLPPPKLSIRSSFVGGEELKPFGDSCIAELERINEGMVYTQQAETAGMAGGKKLAQELLSP